MSCQSPFDLEDPPLGDGPGRSARSGLLAGAGGLGVGVTAVSVFWSSPWWVGAALCALTLTLLTMAGMILFGRRDDATKRLIKIIKALR